MNPFAPHRPDNNSDRDQLAVPRRRQSGPLQQANPQPSPTEKKISSPEELAKQREYFGFDDIPSEDEQDMSGVRFRDIFKAWGKQSVKDSDLEKKLKNSKTRLGRLKKVSNDLKWALQADLDEPVAPHAKQPKKPATPPRVTPTATSQQPSHQAITPPAVPANDKTIDINISFGELPKLPRPKLPSKDVVASKVKRLLSHKKAVIVTGVIIVIAISGAVTSYFYNNQAKQGQQSSDTPTYKTLVPTSKKADPVAWKRISPPDSNAVFAYADKVGDVAINVSQQPLPEDFKDSTSEKVAKLAGGYGATNKIETNGSVDVYIGTSGQGPQSVIFVKKNTLILIKSASKLSDDQWKAYVESLD